MPSCMLTASKPVLRLPSPMLSVNVNWIGSFSDVALASEAAQTHINAGADVLTGTAQMVVGAIGVAKERTCPGLAPSPNQTSLAPEIVVASQVYKWDVVLKQIIDLVKAGTLGGQAFAIDLANKGEVIEFNPDYELPDDVKQTAEDAIKGIADGIDDSTITVIE